MLKRIEPCRWTLFTWDSRKAPGPRVPSKEQRTKIINAAANPAAYGPRKFGPAVSNEFITLSARSLYDPSSYQASYSVTVSWTKPKRPWLCSKARVHVACLPRTGGGGGVFTYDDRRRAGDEDRNSGKELVGLDGPIWSAEKAGPGIYERYGPSCRK